MYNIIYIYIIYNLIYIYIYIHTHKAGGKLAATELFGCHVQWGSGAKSFVCPKEGGSPPVYGHGEGTWRYKLELSSMERTPLPDKSTCPFPFLRCFSFSGYLMNLMTRFSLVLSGLATVGQHFHRWSMAGHWEWRFSTGSELIAPSTIVAPLIFWQIVQV